MLRDFLSKPVDIAALVFFRVVFGILGFAETMALLTYYHWYEDSFNPADFHFQYYGFQWIEPLPFGGMNALLIAMLVAAICIALGRWYRQCTVFFSIGFTYMFLVNKSHYLNHGYLFCWLSWLMVFLPANRAYSGDVLKWPSIRLEKIPYWGLFILQFCMGVVYFFGGIAKINPWWLDGKPLNIWLSAKKDMLIIGGLLDLDFTAYFMSYTGMALDLFVVPFLLFKKTRWWAFGFSVSFHLVNSIIFKIGIFPWLSIALTATFFGADFPRRLFRWLIAKIKKLEKLKTWWDNKFHTSTNLNPIPIKTTSLGIVLIVLLCLTHISLPLRHHFFKGNVAWTEEGHRYSWRMMLRSKRGSGYLKVKNEVTGKIKRIDYKDYMEKKYFRKMLTHPDMILQFAHHIRDEYQAKWQTDSVGVYPHIRVSLNGEKYQRFIPIETNLAEKEWKFFRHADWIIPFEEQR